MIENFKITKAINLIISFLIFISILQSCNGQDKKPEYNPKAIEMNNKAVQYAQTFKEDSALILYDKAIELDDTYYLPHSNKISIYVERKQFDKAVYESEMVIKKKPDLAEGWVFAGMLYDRQGETEKAKKYYEKSIEIFNDRIANPDKTDMISANRLNRAFSYILLGQEEKGKAEMTLLKKEEPENIMIDEFLKISKEDYINQIFGE
ncbi:MAG: tetratricopeptide repeat protein [Flavobacteriales bacterium]|nr:tetratricopeptide repeat protein [Flavobacteriales bacterium]